MAQGTLGAAGVRRVWVGDGLQRAAYRGGGILRGFSYSLLQLVKLTVDCYSRTFIASESMLLKNCSD